MRAASLPLYIWAVARAAGPSPQFRTGYATQRAFAPRPQRNRPATEDAAVHQSALAPNSHSLPSVLLHCAIGPLIKARARPAANSPVDRLAHRYSRAGAGN